MKGMSSFDNATYVTINGQKMTMEQYKKYKKQKAQEMLEKLPKCKQREIARAKREAKKKRKTEISLVPEAIKVLLKNVGPIKSLAAFYDNAYSQWGTISKMILSLPEIERAYILYRADAEAITKTIAEIKAEAKKNSKAVYSYVQRLSWELDNTKTKMKMLYSGVVSSGVLERFADKEIINGEKKRLGLNILMARTFKGLEAIEDAVRILDNIANNGISAIEKKVVMKKEVKTEETIEVEA